MCEGWVAAGVMRELTAFQRDILYAVADQDPPYGLAIKRELEDYYESEVNHGRLYPNLDTLVDAGFLEKSEIDKRTNRYQLTDDAQEVFVARRRWETDHIGEVDLEAEAEEEPTEQAIPADT